MTDSVATRVLGGSPLTVLIRLVAVSLIVGAFMAWLGIDGFDVLYDLERGLARLYGTGFAALRDVGRTLVAGAAVVVPVWAVLRLLSYRGRRPGSDRADPLPLGPGAARASRWSKVERVGD